MDSNEQHTEEKRLRERCKELHELLTQEQTRSRNLERMIYERAQQAAAIDIQRAYTEAEMRQLRDTITRLRESRADLEKSHDRLVARDNKSYEVKELFDKLSLQMEEKNAELRRLRKLLRKQRNVDAATRSAGAAARLAKKGS